MLLPRQKCRQCIFEVYLLQETELGCTVRDHLAFKSARIHCWNLCPSLTMLVRAVRSCTPAQLAHVPRAAGAGMCTFRHKNAIDMAIVREPMSVSGASEAS